jgi:hypothetical protein
MRVRFPLPAPFHLDAAFTVKWDRIQQATFIVSKLECGETAGSLMKLYGLTRENIIDGTAALDLYRLAGSHAQGTGAR